MPPKRRNKRIGFFLSIFYYFLRTCVRGGVMVYYRNHVILNRERQKFNGPGIVVSNHPSTLMDPFNAVAFLNRIMHFLINYGLVRSKFGNWFFNKFYCIPIKRASDLRQGESRDNSDAFDRSNQHLVEGGVLYIAVEGTSITERRLRPSKSGAARIALAAEAEHNFELGLRFLPVGLNYSAPLRFQSDAIVDIGEPFTVTHYKERYTESPKRAIVELTKEIDQRLRAQLIDTSTDEVDTSLRILENLFRSMGPAHPAAEYRRARLWHRKLEKLRTTEPETFQRFAHLSQTYSDKLTNHGFTDAVLHERRVHFAEWLELVLGLPIFLFGASTNSLAAGVPYFAERFAGIDPAYRSTIRFLVGIIVAPLFYVLNWWIFYWIFDSQMLAWLLLAAVFPCGLYAWNWNLLRNKIGAKLRLRKHTERTNLLELRGKILQMFRAWA